MPRNQRRKERELMVHLEVLFHLSEVVADHLLDPQDLAHQDLSKHLGLVDKEEDLEAQRTDHHLEDHLALAVLVLMDHLEAEVQEAGVGGEEEGGQMVPLEVDLTWDSEVGEALEEEGEVSEDPQV